MAIKLANRAMETSTTTGTGTFTLSGVAVAGFQTFAAAGANALTVDYAIEAIDANLALTGQHEVGRGVYTTASNTLTRVTVLESSNGGALENFSAGTKRVFITVAAEDLAVLQNNNVWTIAQTYTLGTITTSQPMLGTVTWNAGGVTFIDDDKDITDTASAAGSLFFRRRVGGVNRWTLGKDSLMTIVKNGALGYQIAVSGQPIIGMGRNSSVGGMNLCGGQATPSDTNSDVWVGVNALKMASGVICGWSSSNVTQGFDIAQARKSAKIHEFNSGVAGTYAGIAFASGTQTIAQLPTAATAGAGARATVSDALAPTFGATVAAGGAVVTPVYSDGSNWKVG